MTRREILVIEDNQAIRQGILDALEYEGYRVFQAEDGTKGQEMAVHDSYDLLLLDLILPGKSGFEILKETRLHRPTLPVIILTAKGEEAEKVRGLNMGADDYIVKPFSVKELLARIEAVLRRSPERPGPVTHIPIPQGSVELARCEVRFDDGTATALSERERDILQYLAVNKNRAISRDEILTRVWHLNPGKVETRTIDMHISRLREKLRDDPENPRLLSTVRGKGYIFVLEE